MFAWIRHRRREALRSQPFPPAWRAIIEKNVPYVAHLPAADRAELEGDVQIFLAEKTFEGCGGLRLTEEIRVTIAAQACILLLHRQTDFYPGLSSILVYPSTYLVPGGRRERNGLVSDDPQARLGESWTHDVVVLAWDSVLSGAADIHDGQNVVLHEFAHQLDQEAGGNGSPALPRRSMYVAWARVLGHDFDQLVQETKAHHKELIDQYGATNPASSLRWSPRRSSRSRASCGRSTHGCMTSYRRSISRIRRPSKTRELTRRIRSAAALCRRRVP